MRILLDETLDWRLLRDLPGHAAESVPLIGWAGLRNGALLTKAEKSFDVLLTMDSNMKTERRALFLLLLSAGLAAVPVRAAAAGGKELIEFGWDEPDTCFLREHIAEIEPLNSIDQGAESTPAKTANSERRHDQVIPALRGRCNHQIHQLVETQPIHRDVPAGPMNLQGAPRGGGKGQGVQEVLHWPCPVQVINRSKLLGEPVGPLGGVTVLRIAVEDLADSVLRNPKLPRDYFSRCAGVTEPNDLSISLLKLWLHRGCGK